MEVCGRSAALLFFMLLLTGSACSVSAQHSGAPEFTATLGQSSVTMTGDWAFHTGDDQDWAQPGFDDSKWEMIAADQPWGAQGHAGYTGFAWYRRRVEIDGVTGPLSIFMPNVDNAYEVYWNGKRVGGFGKLPPHASWNQEPVSNVIALRGAKPDLAGTIKGVLAIRVWKAMNGTLDAAKSGGLNAVPRLGENQAIESGLALEEGSRERKALAEFIGNSVLVLSGTIALGLWTFNRSQRLYLWLGISLLGLASNTLFLFPALGRELSFRWEQILLSIFFTARDLGI